MIRFTAAAFATLLAASAFASDHPQYNAPSYDDVSYGGIPHASFEVPLVHPDGVSVVGSQFDDTRYAPAAEQPAAKRDEARVAETMPCCRHAS